MKENEAAQYAAAKLMPSGQITSPDTLSVLLARTMQVLERCIGLAAGGSKPSFLARRLAAEVEARGISPLSDVLRRAEQGETAAVLALRNLVTVNYSCFWREAAHWPILTEYLWLRFRAGTPVRLWSAACASGEEAYSMAMVAADVALEFPGIPTDWRILASDIDTEALAVAAEGRYSEAALGDLPVAQRSRYLRPQLHHGQPDWQVLPELRSHIDFMRFDLAQPLWPDPPGAPFDVIFMSNVLIYFDKPLQTRILDQAASCLQPNGILLTSRSEGNLGPAGSRLKACGDCAYILAPTARRA